MAQKLHLSHLGMIFGHWTFMKSNGPIILGGMRCRQCGEPVVDKGSVYCYTRDTKFNTNMFQCQQCGQGTEHWQKYTDQIINVEKEAQQKEWLHFARTDCDVLLQRIKNAFYEGWETANTEHADSDIEYYWEDSEAKKIYDVLKELWSHQ